MNKSKTGISASVLASILGGLSSLSTSGLKSDGTPRFKDTRVTKNTRRNKNTPPKFNFVARGLNGCGYFLNLHTNKVECKKISSERLSRSALKHFGLSTETI